jgi:hypothetical protein
MASVFRIFSPPLRTRYPVRKAAVRVLPDSLYAKLAYRRNYGRFPRNPPETFNERIAALIGSGQLSRYAPYSDKLAVRDFVTQRAGVKYLVPLHTTADRLTRDLWDRLPDSFMLKPNHGSGWALAVEDKHAEDFDALVTKTDNWLRKNYYYLYRESQYRSLKPVLMLEKLLRQSVEEGGRRGEAHKSGLIDYKIFCFHGKAQMIHVVMWEQERRRLLYDFGWNKLAVRYKLSNDGEIPRPTGLEEMRTVAEALSRDFDFVRVDMFDTPDGVFFGELTFTPLVGSDPFEPLAFDAFLGDLWAGAAGADEDVMARWRVTP